MRAGTLASLAAIAAAACGAPAPLPPTPPPPPSATVAPVALDPGTFRSRRSGLELPLPDGRAWRIDDHSSSWLVAEHDTLGTLAVRLWRAERGMSRDECEAQARALRPLPRAEGATLLEERRLDVPSGFDTVAKVGLVEAGGALHGFVLAFGGWNRRCFAYAYVTKAEGPGADQTIGDRLAQQVEASLAVVRVVRDFDVPLDRDQR